MFISPVLFPYENPPCVSAILFEEIIISYINYEYRIFLHNNLNETVLTNEKYLIESFAKYFSFSNLIMNNKFYLKYSIISNITNRDENT